MEVKVFFYVCVDIISCLGLGRGSLGFHNDISVQEIILPVQEIIYNRDIE